MDALIIGGILSLLVGAIFEAFLMGTLVFTVFVLIIYLSLLVFVLDAVKVYAASGGNRFHGTRRIGTRWSLDQSRLPYEFKTA